MAQTVEVFATRQGISPASFYQLLESEERMDEEVFSRLPRQTLLGYRARLIEMNVNLLTTFLDSAIPVKTFRRPKISQNS
jgi:hypothetical protein